MDILSSEAILFFFLCLIPCKLVHQKMFVRLYGMFEGMFVALFVGMFASILKRYILVYI